MKHMSKKGQWQILFLSPWVLLGLAIFVLILLAVFLINIKLLVAVALIAVGLIVFLRTFNPYVPAVFILIGLFMLFFNGSGFSLALFGISQPYTLETQDAKITFYTADNYWEITGCEPAPNLGACSVRSVDAGSIGGCTLQKYYGTAWQDCESRYESNCAYGENCDQYSGYGLTYCSKHCSAFAEREIGVYGGPKYSDFDNCAWYVTVQDNSGKLIKEFSQTDKYGASWSKERYFRDPIDAKIGQTSLKYISDEYGIVQRRLDGSTIKNCLAVNFRAEDDRYIYDVCLGNDGIDGPKCSDVLTKTCKLTCYRPQKLDVGSCSCIDAPLEQDTPQTEPQDPVPELPASCSDGYVIKDGSCQKLSWWDKIVAWFRSLKIKWV